MEIAFVVLTSLLCVEGAVLSNSKPGNPVPKKFTNSTPTQIPHAELPNITIILKPRPMPIPKPIPMPIPKPIPWDPPVLIPWPTAKLIPLDPPKVRHLSFNADDGPSRWKKEECVHVKKIKPEGEFGRSCWKCWPDFCKDLYYMYYLDMEPYSGPMFRTILRETVQHCCWDKFIKPEVDFKPATNLSYLIEENLKKKITGQSPRIGDDFAHFIFPVIGYRNFERMHGHYFVPLLEPPGCFYVTPKVGIDLANLVEQCFKLWPLLLMCVAMSTIAGKSPSDLDIKQLSCKG